MTRPLPDVAFLDQAGLNRQHVFNLADLPADLLAPLGVLPHERQLILFGHAGRRLWECVQAEGLDSKHPIDEYSLRTVERWLAQALPAARARFVFPLPAHQPIGLQRLGSLAGWHRASPFMVGIDSVWGSWFAYRAVILLDSDLPLTAPVDNGYPCASCTAKPCITACPAGALAGGSFNFALCSDWRLREGSACSHGCLARRACPAGAEHRYEDAQIRHSYGYSLAAIRSYQQAR